MKRRILTILRQQAVVDPAAERAEKVYEWVSHLTAETRYASGNFKDYYITKDGRRLHYKLTHMDEGLVGVVGLQGTGKTSLLKVLAKDLNSEETPTIFISWTPNWMESLKTGGLWQTYKENVYDLLYDKAAGYAQAQKKLGGYHVDRDVLNAIENRSFHFEAAQVMLGSSECRKAWDEAVYEKLRLARYVFIDLPDYSKKHRGEMNRDWSAVQSLWKGLRKEAERSQVFVFGIQKEMFGGHFIYGKMDIVELSPFKPEEMLEAYRKTWETTEPFTEDALLLLAELSRGIFRRFLKYIQRCIEETSLGKKEFPITVENVREAVTLDQLVKDMDLELSEVFTNKEQKILAVKLLNCIREHKQINQTKIAELLGINDMTVSRLIGKLEAYGYVKRERGQHAEWLVSLA